jgi:hypothetical protein
MHLVRPKRMLWNSAGTDRRAFLAPTKGRRRAVYLTESATVDVIRRRLPIRSPIGVATHSIPS